MKKLRTRYLRGTAIALLAIVLALDAAFVLLPDRGFSPTENRNLQTLPGLSLRGVTSGRFESRFEDYVADQFPFRDGWIVLKSSVDRLMGRRESNGVFLADDGYLIQNFTYPDQAAYQANLQALRGFISRHAGMPQYALVAPTAITVLADKLPANAIVGDEGGYLNRLKADLSDLPVSFIDLRGDFMGRQEQLYYHTDHHWTTGAAHLAYLKLAEVAELSGAKTNYTPRLLSNAFQGTLTASSGFRTGSSDDLYAYLPDSPVKYVVSYVGESRKSATVYRPEMLDEKDQYTVFFGGNHPQIKIDTTVDNGRRLLVLKDSYANCFIPFLLEDYERLIVVDPRYYTGEIEVLMEAEGVNEILFLYNASTLASDTSLRNDLARPAISG